MQVQCSYQLHKSNLLYGRAAYFVRRAGTIKFIRGHNHGLCIHRKQISDDFSGCCLCSLNEKQNGLRLNMNILIAHSGETIFSLPNYCGGSESVFLHPCETVLAQTLCSSNCSMQKLVELYILTTLSNGTMSPFSVEQKHVYRVKIKVKPTSKNNDEKECLFKVKDHIHCSYLKCFQKVSQKLTILPASLRVYC